MNRRIVSGWVAIVAVAVLLFAPASGHAALTVPNSAADVVEAITPMPFVTEASAEPGIISALWTPSLRPSPNTTAVSTTALARFPREGDAFAIFSTGDALAADDDGAIEASTDYMAQGLAPFGSPGGNAVVYDFTRFEVKLRVPVTANCLSIDFRFLSEEYETDYEPPAGDDELFFALEGQLAPLGAVFVTPESPAPFTATQAAAIGTVYHAATGRGRVSYPVAGGEVATLRFGVYDMAGTSGPDHFIDTAAFVDRLRTSSSVCQAALGIAIAETTIDSGPAGTTNDSTPTFAFSSGEPDSTFECRIGSDPFGACSGPGATHTATLADGNYTFEVRAIDPESGPGTTASRSFTIDTTPPAPPPLPDPTPAPGPAPAPDPTPDDGSACADAQAAVDLAAERLKKAKAKLKKAKAAEDEEKIERAKVKVKKGKAALVEAKAALEAACPA